jgi:Nitrile hydratase beta subunit, N-terminal
VERGVHDRADGGSEHDLADWELRMDAIENVLEKRGVLNTDEMRRGIESMPLEAYEAASY